MRRSARIELQRGVCPSGCRFYGHRYRMSHQDVLHRRAQQNPPLRRTQITDGALSDTRTYPYVSPVCDAYRATFREVFRAVTRTFRAHFACFAQGVTHVSPTFRAITRMFRAYFTGIAPVITHISRTFRGVSHTATRQCPTASDSLVNAWRGHWPRPLSVFQPYSLSLLRSHAA